MLNISNGAQELVVTRGAYESVYAPLGWRLTNDLPKETHKPVKPFPSLKPETTPPEDKVPEEEEYSPSTDEEYLEDEEEEDWTEKPLSEMSFEELKAYAEMHKVDIDGLRSKKEVRMAIREAL